QSGAPYPGPRIISEDKECRTNAADLGKRKSVHDGLHRVFTDAEMQILAARSVRLETAGALIGQGGFVRRCEVCRAAQQPGDVLGEHVQHLAGRVTPGESFRIGRERGEVAIPTGGQLAALHLIDLGCERGKLRSVGREELGPFFASFRAPLADAGSEVLVYAGGHEKLRVFGPAVGTLRKLYLVLPERF